MSEFPDKPLLDKLATFGDPRKTWRWAEGDPDYVSALVLQPQHVPALIEIARQWVTREDWPEDEADLSIYAPIHAWRALAQLRASEAIGPLLDMLGKMDERGDGWHLEEFPDAFALIGPEAIGPLASYLADAGHGTYARICAGHSLQRIAEDHPDTREQVVGLLTGSLAQHEENEAELNAFLIAYLLDLKATESAEAIERAYAAGNVDERICGGWHKVRVGLGVPGLGLVKEPEAPSSRGPAMPPLIQTMPPSIQTDHRLKNRLREQRKRQRKAKKQNRKRR